MRVRAAADGVVVRSHAFTVTARDSDGGTSSSNATDAVVPFGTPIISEASQTARRWRENNALARISAGRRAPLGTTFSFALNEPAAVTLSFTQQLAGRKLHGQCVTPSKRIQHNARCSRTTVMGMLTFAGHPGTNKVRFAGGIANANKLRLGRYALRSAPPPPATSGPRTQSLAFTIVS